MNDIWSGDSSNGTLGLLACSLSLGMEDIANSIGDVKTDLVQELDSQVPICIGLVRYREDVSEMSSVIWWLADGDGRVKLVFFGVRNK